MQSNADKVRQVEAILSPYYTHDMNFYWDVLGGRNKVDSVEELQVLHFKRQMHDPRDGRFLFGLPGLELEGMINQIKRLNIGKSVEFIKVQGIGQFIVVDLAPPAPRLGQRPEHE